MTVEQLAPPQVEFAWDAPAWSIRRRHPVAMGRFVLTHPIVVRRTLHPTPVAPRLRSATGKRNRTISTSGNAHGRRRVSHAYAGMPLATMPSPASEASGFSRQVLITNAAQNVAYASGTHG